MICIVIIFFYIHFRIVVYTILPVSNTRAAVILRTIVIVHNIILLDLLLLFPCIALSVHGFLEVTCCIFVS